MDRGDFMIVGAFVIAGTILHIAYRLSERLKQDRRTADKMLRHRDFEGTGLFI